MNGTKLGSISLGKYFLGVHGGGILVSKNCCQGEALESWNAEDYSRTTSTTPRWKGKSWGGNGVMTLTRRLTNIKDEVIHNPVNLGRHRPLLFCVLLHKYIGWGLDSSHLTKEPAVRFPIATDEKATCKHEVHMQTFTGTLKIINKSGLLYESSVMSWLSGTWALSRS